MNPNMLGKGNMNNALQNMLNLMQSGTNPQQVIDMIVNKNPNFNTTMQQVQNMAKGRSPEQFAMDLAKQNGLNENQVRELARRFGAK